MHVLLLRGAPRSSKIENFLRENSDKLTLTTDPLTKEYMDEIQPDWLVCHGYAPIIKPEVCQLFPRRIVNIHNTYLPWGRGLGGNAWSFFDDTPKGVSLHFIDAGIDTGELIIQREVTIPRSHDLESSWHILMDELENLFIDTWPAIVNQTITPTPQSGLGQGSYHDKRITDALMALMPDGWKTSLQYVYELGREHERDPEAFEQRYGIRF